MRKIIPQEVFCVLIRLLVFKCKTLKLITILIIYIGWDLHEFLWLKEELIYLSSKCDNSCLMSTFGLILLSSSSFYLFVLWRRHPVIYREPFKEKSWIIFWTSGHTPNLVRKMQRWTWNLFRQFYATIFEWLYILPWWMIFYSDKSIM